jgi:hypothetical protein
LRNWPERALKSYSNRWRLAPTTRRRQLGFIILLSLIFKLHGWRWLLHGLLTRRATGTPNRKRFFARALGVSLQKQSRFNCAFAVRSVGLPVRFQNAVCHHKTGLNGQLKVIQTVGVLRQRPGW